MLTGAAPAPATTIPPTPTVFSCKAPGGHYERHDLVANGASIESRIRLVRPAADPVWFPGAGLLFILPGKSNYAGVQIFRDPNFPTQLTIGLRKPHNNTPTPVARVPIGSSPDVYARFADGVLTVGLAAGSKPVELSLKLSRNAPLGQILMCSSGEFEFELQNGLAVQPPETAKSD